MKDIFGHEISEGDALHIRRRRDPVPNGYAARTGTGPAGETCGSCAHLYRNRMAKTYLKCGLMRAHWTGGRATDVLARAPACREWSRPDPEEVERELRG